jgi:hypothetical protein
MVYKQKETSLLFDFNETHRCTSMPQKGITFSLIRKGKYQFYSIQTMGLEHVRCITPEESRAKCEIIYHKSSKA